MTFVNCTHLRPRGDLGQREWGVKAVFGNGQFLAHLRGDLRSFHFFSTGISTGTVLWLPENCTPYKLFVFSGNH